VSQTSVPQEEFPRLAARINRRATIRYRCAPATVGKVFSAGDQEFQRAWVLDLSLSGIGMELSRPLEAGRLVLITIRSHDGVMVHELSASVRRCCSVPQNSWFVGCELTVPLSPDELEQLL